MSWGNAEWDADCDSKLVENLFSQNVSTQKKKRKKHKNKPSDSFLEGVPTAGRFVRVNPKTDFSDTSSLYVKPKVIHNNKRKLLAKDNSSPKKIRLDTLNNVSDDPVRSANNEKVNVPTAGRFVRVNPKTHFSDTRSLYVKPKVIHNNKRKLLAKDNSSPKKIRLDTLNNVSDDPVRTSNNEKGNVDGKDQSTCQKTRKRKRKKKISLEISEELKSYPKQKKIPKKCRDVDSVSKQILNEKDILLSSETGKPGKNHKISIDSNFHGNMSHTKMSEPKPKNVEEENSQHTSIRIKSKSPYKINQLKQYLKKHVSSLSNITPTQSPANSLREKMMKQLQASHFRYINEQLYNSKSEESKTFFQNNISTFEAYHEGYRQQVSKWPMNPLSVIINTLKKKPAKTLIADFGCGEANLAKSLPDHKVYSFDFVATSDVVTPCDMSNAPLENESVDIVVFCLSLMGSNLSSYILEANRVLKNGGMMMIAEVESRFENVDTFIQDIKKFGFTNTWKDFSHKIFYFLYFKKVSSVKKSNKLPSIFLKPCLYKKR